MIFGWLRDGRTDRWVLVDPHFPWPALHHGRNVLREWADSQNRRRAIEHSAGPRRMPWPCRTHVKESGGVELHVWPVEIYGKPRRWTDGDDVWRQPLRDLAELMQLTVACEVKLDWCGGAFEPSPSKVKSLQDQAGFIGWARGEHEPRSISTGAGDGGKVSVGGTDIRIMPQGEHAWL
jgi:hypothetical protein